MFTDTAVPASLTAVHFALAILRRHRTGRTLSPFVVPSFAITITPWLVASSTMMLSGLAVHLVWLVLCEVVAPGPAAGHAPARPPARPPVPATPVGQRQPRPTAPQPQVKSPSPGFAPTSVLAVLDEADDIRTFRLERPDGFTFTAGQFLAVKVQIDGKPHVRCYSISSSPETRGYVEISVRKQGLVSSTLHATVRTGSRLSVNQPAGQFVFPANDDRPLALVAGGIGITPLMSMLRHSVASHPTRPVTLLYSAKRASDLAFLSELRVIAQRNPQVRIMLTLTQSQSDAAVRHGRIDAAWIRQHVPNPTHTIFCICGPSGMIARVRTDLLAMGVPAPQVRAEEFETAIAAASLNLVPAPAPGRTPSARAPREEGQHRITFATSGRTVLVGPDQTLLDAAEAEGVMLASSCRSGVCQACRTHLTSGEADCRSSVLDDDDRQSGFILPCVTFASSDCVLDA